MRGFINKLKNKISISIKGVVFEGIIFTIFLSLVVLVIGGNIIRVFTNGRSNYDTFIQEQDELDKLQAKNGELKDDLNYVNSDEYKQLLLRDAQSMAEGNEELFQSKEKPQYFAETPEYLDLKLKKNFNDWWDTLLN